MEVELSDDKDIDRLAMPPGMLTPSISGIVYRTFVYNLVLTSLPKLSFLNFLDEMISASKTSYVGTCVTGSVSLLQNLES